jgi:hypothetical protein
MSEARATPPLMSGTMTNSITLTPESSTPIVLDSSLSSVI